MQPQTLSFAFACFFLGLAFGAMPGDAKAATHAGGDVAALDCLTCPPDPLPPVPPPCPPRWPECPWPAGDGEHAHECPPETCCEPDRRAGAGGGEDLATAPCGPENPGCKPPVLV